MKQMTATEFDKLNIKETLAALPVEVTSSGKTLFFAMPDTPESRSAANTYTEDQVIQILVHTLQGDPQAHETAREKINHWKQRLSR